MSVKLEHHHIALGIVLLLIGVIAEIAAVVFALLVAVWSLYYWLSLAEIISPIEAVFGLPVLVLVIGVGELLAFIFIHFAAHLVATSWDMVRNPSHGYDYS